MPATRSDQLAGELLKIVDSETFRDPLLDDVRAGRMSRNGVKLWAIQATLVVRQFTRFISAIHSNCPYREAQQLLAENLWEEHGRGFSDRDHFTLVCRLAKSLGATDEELSQAEALPETTQYIDHCFHVTREGSFVEGLAAIGVGVEYYMPKFFGALGRTLCERYGLSRGDVEYLLVHVAEDEDHARRSLELVARYADSDELKEKTKRAVRDMLAVKRSFAQALDERCRAEV